MTRKGERTNDTYGPEHQAMRAELAPLVAQGLINCWRCDTPIRDQPWDLGHDDERTRIMGPEHRHAQPDVGCPGNRAKGGAARWAQPKPKVEYGPREAL